MRNFTPAGQRAHERPTLPCHQTPTTGRLPKFFRKIVGGYEILPEREWSQDAVYNSLAPRFGTKEAPTLTSDEISRLSADSSLIPTTPPRSRELRPHKNDARAERRRPSRQAEDYAPDIVALARSARPEGSGHAVGFEQLRQSQARGGSEYCGSNHRRCNSVTMFWRLRFGHQPYSPGIARRGILFVSLSHQNVPAQRGVCSMRRKIRNTRSRRALVIAGSCRSQLGTAHPGRATSERNDI